MKEPEQRVKLALALAGSDGGVTGEQGQLLTCGEGDNQAVGRSAR